MHHALALPVSTNSGRNIYAVCDIAVTGVDASGLLCLGFKSGDQFGLVTLRVVVFYLHG